MGLRKYDEAFDGEGSDAESDAYEVESMRQQYARIVALLGQTRTVMDVAGHGWLYHQLANAIGNFVEYAVDPSYRYPPRQMPDVDAERERLKLYGSDKQHSDDVRNAKRLDGIGPDNLFDWERR